MLVNSFVFWLFFPIVLIVYYTILGKNKKAQNIWLLVASYFFYGYVEIKMIPVILISTLLYYWMGLKIEKENDINPKVASRYTTFGVVMGVGILFYFKYLNFCIDQFALLFEQLGLHTNIHSFNILMPLGVSYFTFKLISYLIEVHRGNIGATKDLMAFGTYVAFFPTIMAGPIDRPNQFLPQLETNRVFKYDNVAEGCRRILWGMFLKMCIADRISPYVDAVFQNYTHHNATTIIVASFLASIEMYADFCGYSDMAIGVGKMMGISIRENFNRPFFAQNIADFWRRWHMSLTTWITDYIFKPLTIVFREWGMWGLHLATVLNLVIIGAWHGANWTYVVFGLYHGALMIIVASLEKRRKKFEKKHALKDKWYYKYPRMALTFVFFTIGMVLFNATSVGEYFSTWGQMFSVGFGPLFTEHLFKILTMAMPALILVLYKEYNDENKKSIHFLHSDKMWVRLFSFVIIMLYILTAAEFDGGAFIYYQF